MIMTNYEILYSVVLSMYYMYTCNWNTLLHYLFFCVVDDMLIKLWDWDKNWQCSQVFEGHTHYVMMIVLNPKDNNQFASASLDKTIKVGNPLHF